MTRIDRGMRVCRPRPKFARTIVPISEPLLRVPGPSSCRWASVPLDPSDEVPGAGATTGGGSMGAPVAEVYLARPSERGRMESSPQTAWPAQGLVANRSSLRCGSGIAVVPSGGYVKLRMQFHRCSARSPRDLHPPS